jgi:hypothetical protein
MNHRTSAAIIITATVAAVAYSQSIAFTGRLRIVPEWQHVKTDGASIITERFSEIVAADHTTGTNANQMTSFARASGTLTNSAETAVNLLSATNSFGDTLVLRRVNFLCVTAPAANANAISIGGASAEAFETWGSLGGTIVIRPGGTVLMHAPDATGYAVGTNGMLRVFNQGTNTVSYLIYIGGVQ